MLRGSDMMCLHDFKPLTGMSLALLLLNPLMQMVSDKNTLLLILLFKYSENLGSGKIGSY